MIHHEKMALLAIAIAFTSVSAAAQQLSNNVLFLIQDSTIGASGNQIFVDQSLASTSVVAGVTDAQVLPSSSPSDLVGVTTFLSGLNPDPSVPAIQSGGGNIASISLAASGSIVGLSQTSPRDGLSNFGSITLGALAPNSSASLVQYGIGNSGTLIMGLTSAIGSTAQLFQNGDGNTGQVRIFADGVIGTLVQNGNRNNYNLEVDGPPGTRVNWEQIGDNLTAASTARIVTNGATVFVRQSRASAP